MNLSISGDYTRIFMIFTSCIQYKFATVKVIE